MLSNSARIPQPPYRASTRSGRGWLVMLLVAAALATQSSSASYRSAVGKGAAALHVPSPDWRDQVIYFAMTDRFDDGDPGNNDQHAGEYAAADSRKYNGGDLAGVARRLDYIRGLGATAIWLTPPVANKWWDTGASYGGYHGYWTEDFMRVDAHLGTLADYQALSRRIHGAGMYLVQDIVLNHTANYFSYAGNWRAEDPSAGFQLSADSRGRTAPGQWPFSMNDARDPRQREAAIYHWTPDVTDYKDPAQVSSHQMAGLDDLNSENPAVRAALRKSYGFWIREAGIDAFRIDTAFYVPTDALADFLYSTDPVNPGVLAVAARTGRNRFHVFGEGFATDRPFDDTQARRIDQLMRRADGSKVLPGMLNFPLYASIGDVFARGHPTAELAYRIDDMMRVHAQPWLMPTFLDNHDVDRFLAGGNEAGLRQGLLLMMTLPGIPTIYYGTEQAFRLPRAAMFKAGSDSGGVDHFDTSAPLYRFIRRATDLRRQHRLFSRGWPTLLKSSAAGPGVLAYRMQAGAEAALVVFNTADHEVLVDNLETGLRAGAMLSSAFEFDAKPVTLIAGRAGRTSFVLPARGARVWLLADARRSRPAARPAISIDALASTQVSSDFVVAGSAAPGASLRLVVDGDLSSARAVAVAGDGRWQARVDTAAMIDPGVEHEVVAWSNATATASDSRRFHVSRRWQTLFEGDDPAGDDAGPSKRYQSPIDATWREHHPMDIRHVRVEGAGGAMRISLRMNAVSTSWNPPNGFDHVAFSIFIGLPGQADGSRRMPFQNAQLPDGMAWQVRARVHGWSNALFTARGADADHDGTPAAPAPVIAVDAGTATISFTFAASALGRLDTLHGVRVYVASWDYDGGFRPLAPVAAAGNFGGGDGRRDPLVMDDTQVIRLP